MIAGKLRRVLQAKLKELEEGTLVPYTPQKLFTCCQRHMHAPQPRQGNCSELGRVTVEQPQASNYLWGCVFSPRDPRAKRLVTRLRIPLQTPTEPQLTWFFVAMGNTQGSRGFVFGRLIGKQARS